MVAPRNGVVMLEAVKLTGDAGADVRVAHGPGLDHAVASANPLFCDACQKLVHRLVTGGSSAGDFIR